MSKLSRIALPLVLIGATVFVFDLVAYFVVPTGLTAFASSFRKTRLLSGPTGQPALTRSDPRHYYRADDALGFDHNPGARMIHEFGEEDTEIFVNSLGCFDRNELATLQAAKEYHYFGGDSFTWGFASYDSKFATVWERATGKVAAKCGVAHTGQAAQLEKFKRVTRAIGKVPATVFVGFYVNDPANDGAFPHTTVVEGYMVDTAFERDGAIVHPDIAEVKKVVLDGLRVLEAPQGPVDRIKTAVWVFSLSANIANHGLLALKGTLDPAPPGGAAAPAGGPAVRSGARRPMSKFGDNLYYWYDTGRMKEHYAADPRTEANREAIRRWAVHARENSYRLAFLLFPPKDGHDDPALFTQVRAFLDANGIEYLDFAQLFKAEGLKGHDLYWKTNGHWNPNGNRVVGRLLAKRY